MKRLFSLRGAGAYILFGSTIGLFIIAIGEGIVKRIALYVGLGAIGLIVFIAIAVIGIIDNARYHGREEAVRTSIFITLSAIFTISSAVLTNVVFSPLPSTPLPTPTPAIPAATRTPMPGPSPTPTSTPQPISTPDRELELAIATARNSARIATAGVVVSALGLISSFFFALRSEQRERKKAELEMERMREEIKQLRNQNNPPE